MLACGHTSLAVCWQPLPLHERFCVAASNGRRCDVYHTEVIAMVLVRWLMEQLS